MSPEQYLRDNGGWVPAKQLASICQCNERLLRGEESPIRHVAISGDKGYRHIEKATQEEIEHFCNRLRLHSIQQLRHSNAIRRARKQLVQPELFHEQRAA